MMQFSTIAYLLIGLGAVCSAAGAIMLYIDSDRQQREIIRLNETITSTVTGGDSYPLVSPVFVAAHGEEGDIRHLHLGHHGKHPVYDLVVIAYDVVKLRELTKRKQPFIMKEYAWRFHVGTIGRGYEDRLMSIPAPDREKMMFYFIFMARNGQFEERAIYQKIKGKWYTATRLMKDDKLQFEQITPDAPVEMITELRQEHFL